MHWSWCRLGTGASSSSNSAAWELQIRLRTVREFGRSCCLLWIPCDRSTLQDSTAASADAASRTVSSPGLRLWITKRICQITVFDTLEIQIYILYVYYYDMYVVLKYMYIIFTEEVPMGGGDVHIVEMRRNACFFLLFLIRMYPFAHLLSLHRFWKCYFQPRVPKPVEKRKNKTRSFTPCPLSSFSDPLYMGRNCLFLFVSPRVFATLSVQQWWCLGSGNVHPDKHRHSGFTPPHFIP